jgi:hypothetical protein
VADAVTVPTRAIDRALPESAQFESAHTPSATITRAIVPPAFVRGAAKAIINAWTPVRFVVLKVVAASKPSDERGETNA